ncbi:MAG: glycosyltransferase [Acidobacteria bacterium]|nr:glycosyltransferase [Acidobacteriota bacterium]
MIGPRISFVVPVLNDAKRLAMCLQSIRRNLAAQGLVEIVVVDNGSTDGSADVARQLGATVIVADGRVSALRNLGASRATGDILAFVDADHEIGSAWVVSARDVLRMKGVGAAGALYRPPLDGTWVQRAYGQLRGRALGQSETDWLGSGNLAVWRRVFEEIGGFDTQLEACEDVDLCQRIRAAGHRLMSDARLDTIHHGDPETLRDVFKSELWRGRDNLRVSFRSPFSWSNLPSALMPLVDIAMLVVGLGALVAAAMGWVHGLTLALVAAGVVITGSLLKVMRARQKDSNPSSSLLATLVVAFVYDLARACALLTRAPHRGAARSSPAAAV